MVDQLGKYNMFENNLLKKKTDKKGGLLRTYFNFFYLLMN